MSLISKLIVAVIIITGTVCEEDSCEDGKCPRYGRNSLPADSIFEFLRGWARSNEFVENSTCLVWGPFPPASLPTEFVSKCGRLLQVVQDWELHPECAGKMGVFMQDPHANLTDTDELPMVQQGIVCADEDEVGASFEHSAYPMADVLIDTREFVLRLEPFSAYRATQASRAVRPGGKVIFALPTLKHGESGIRGSAAVRNTRRSVGVILSAAKLCVEEVSEHGDPVLMAGILLGMRYQDFSHESLLSRGTTQSRSIASPTITAHTVIAAAHVPLHAGKCESVPRAETSWMHDAIRVVVLTQATHKYLSFVPDLAESLSVHLASSATRRHSAESGRESPHVQVVLVVFTDSAEGNGAVEGWDATWKRGSAVGSGDMRMIHVHVLHYGWPQLALRRWETYLHAEALLRDAHHAIHIDCDARATASLTSSLLSTESFGVLHADNAYYSGDEALGFDQRRGRYVRVRDLPGFLTDVRSEARGYWDQACFPRFCRVPPPYHDSVGQRCSMGDTDGEYYFYSGFFGGTSTWMTHALHVLRTWTDDDLSRGYQGARVDDESYLNRFFFESRPSVVLTCAFMYPQPPYDDRHPWLWSNFPRDEDAVRRAFPAMLMAEEACATQRRTSSLGGRSHDKREVEYDEGMYDDDVTQLGDHDSDHDRGYRDDVGHDTSHDKEYYKGHDKDHDRGYQDMGHDTSHDKEYYKGHDKDHDGGYQDMGHDTSHDKEYYKGHDKDHDRGYQDMGYDTSHDKEYYKGHDKDHDRGYQDMGYDTSHDKEYYKGHDKDHEVTRGLDLCWNTSGAYRWFTPMVLNVVKDKTWLFRGSDDGRLRGLGDIEVPL